MFRRRLQTLPKDPSFPTDLEQLGYFINEKDQIRQIRNPEQKYQFAVNKNDRINDVYKEAMNGCVRKEVSKRLSSVGLETYRLPLRATEAEPHVDILVSRNLEAKKRVIVVFGERALEAGIFSYRVIGDEGINTGSAVDFVKSILQGPRSDANGSFPKVSEEQTPGIVIANPGQLYWYRGGKRAVTWSEWQGLPRQSALHEAYRVDETKNKIPGNGDYEDHVISVFHGVLEETLAQDVKIDIIALEQTGAAVLKYLACNWAQWRGRVFAISLCNPQHKIDDFAHLAPGEFADFIGKRCRAYMVGHQRTETPLPGREETGCNCYASGEELYQENIIVRIWGRILDWFNMVHTLQDYAEPVFVLEDGDGSGDASNWAK